MFHKKIIQRNWAALVEDLDTTPVVDIIYSKGFLSDSEKNEITGERRHERARLLLSMIQRKSEEAFLQFRNALEESHPHLYHLISRDIQEHISSETSHAVSNVAATCELYQHREQIQKEICQAFCTSKRVFLVGMMGSGKTQLCRWYASQFTRKQEEKNIHVAYWIDGASEESLNLGVQNLFQTLKCKNIVKNTLTGRFNTEIMKFEERGNSTGQKIKVLLERLRAILMNTNSLLIVDGLTRKAMDTFKEIEMELDSCSILVSTNEEYQQGCAIKVDGFTDGEALSFSKKILRSPEYEHEDIQKLFKLLANSPLGLTSSLQYINKMQFSVEKYLQLLKSETAIEDVQSHEGRIIHQKSDYGKTLYSAIQLTLSILREQFGEDFDVVKYMCICDCEKLLPIRVFLPLLSGNHRTLRMAQLLQALQEIHLLSESRGLDNNREVCFHGIIKTVMQNNIKEEIKTLVSNLMIHMASCFGFRPSLELVLVHSDWSLYPHILSLLSHARAINITDTKVLIARIQLQLVLGFKDNRFIRSAMDEYFELIGMKYTDLSISQKIEAGLEVDFLDIETHRLLEEEANQLVTKIDNKLGRVLNADDVYNFAEYLICESYQCQVDPCGNLENLRLSDMYGVLFERCLAIDHERLTNSYLPQILTLILCHLSSAPQSKKECLDFVHNVYLTGALSRKIRENYKYESNSYFLSEVLALISLGNMLTQVKCSYLQSRAHFDYIIKMVTEYFSNDPLINLFGHIYPTRGSNYHNRIAIGLHAALYLYALRCMEALYGMVENKAIKQNVLADAISFISTNHQILTKLDLDYQHFMLLTEASIYLCANDDEKVKEFCLLIVNGGSDKEYAFMWACVQLAQLYTKCNRKENALIHYRNAQNFLLKNPDCKVFDGKMDSLRSILDTLPCTEDKQSCVCTCWAIFSGRRYRMS